jgi:hypothetical protein
MENIKIPASLDPGLLDQPLKGRGRAGAICEPLFTPALETQRDHGTANLETYLPFAIRSPESLRELFTIRFGHRHIGWIAFGQRRIRETLDTGIPGVYLLKDNSDTTSQRKGDGEPTLRHLQKNE